MPRPTRKTRDKSSRAGEAPGSRQRGKRGAGGAGKKKLITIEAGICMKTNKTTTICPEKKGHFCITKRHFMQRHTSFAEIGGFIAAIGALGNESRASKCGKSSPGTDKTGGRHTGARAWPVRDSIKPKGSHVNEINVAVLCLECFTNSSRIVPDGTTIVRARASVLLLPHARSHGWFAGGSRVPPTPARPCLHGASGPSNDSFG